LATAGYCGKGPFLDGNQIADRTILTDDQGIEKRYRRFRMTCHFRSMAESRLTIHPMSIVWSPESSAK
jgi:hypothetical protein